ncbi:glycosyltransferase family 39 protein [Krasilnikovia sp. MM14-A1004]|uniref:glycosyltransferase family 39 protein n=1 Tax=Krasilnikovia sp. MM14-A1004 TaxID=3373541 RepID=UPI00399C78B0
MPDTIAVDVATAAGPPGQLLPRQRGDTAPDRRAGRRLDPVIWVLPALLAAGLGVWRLTGPALWADELATWGAVRLSWGELWRLSHAVDAVLTPYYAAMKVYTTVAGTSTAALRLPALLATVGTTLVVVALGRRLGGRWAGLTAGLLFAVLPVTSRYAQEARPYACVMLAASLAVLCLIRLLDDPGGARATAYAGAVLFAGLSHPLCALLVLAAHAATVAVRQIGVGTAARYGTVAWLGAALPGALGAGALIALGYRSRTQISWIRHLTLSAFQVFPDRLFLSGAVGGIVLGLAVLAVRRDLGHVGVAAAGFMPILVLLAADRVTPIWVARYVLVAVPPLTVLAACAAVRWGRVRALAVVTLAAVLGYPSQLSVRGSAGHGADSAKVATVIGPLWKPGDVVVFPDTHDSIPWAPRDLYDRYLPVPRPADVLQLEPPRTHGRFPATECPDASCLGNPPRIWVVRVDDPADPFRDMSPGKQKRLRDGYQPVKRWTYPELGVVLLERKRPGRSPVGASR